MKALLLAATTCLMTGCATTIYAPNIENENAAQVYFIRQRAEPLVWNLFVNLDDNKVVSLSNKSYAKFKYSPGKHKFALKWPALAGQTNLAGELEFQPKASHYYLIESYYKFLDVKSFPGTSSYSVIFNGIIRLQEINQATAEQIMITMPKK